MRLLLIVVVALNVGCDSTSPFDYERVSGKITYDDGTVIPAGGMRLQFVAQDAPAVANAVPRPAYANVDSQGQFECVTSYKYGDGLIPGRHKVAIDVGTGPGGKPLVPKAYTSISTTPLIVDTADAPFDLKVPKPKATR